MSNSLQDVNVPIFLRSISFQNSQLNCKCRGFSNPRCGILISGPRVWTVIMSDPILKKLSSPSTDNNLKSLRHSMLYLNLSPSDSL